MLLHLITLLGITLIIFLILTLLLLNMFRVLFLIHLYLEALLQMLIKFIFLLLPLGFAGLLKIPLALPIRKLIKFVIFVLLPLLIRKYFMRVPVRFMEKQMFHHLPKAFLWCWVNQVKQDGLMLAVNCFQNTCCFLCIVIRIFHLL